MSLSINDLQRDSFVRESKRVKARLVPRNETRLTKRDLFDEKTLVGRNETRSANVGSQRIRRCIIFSQGVMFWGRKVSAEIFVQYVKVSSIFYVLV